MDPTKGSKGLPPVEAKGDMARVIESKAGVDVGEIGKVPFGQEVTTTSPKDVFLGVGVSSTPGLSQAVTGGFSELPWPIGGWGVAASARAFREAHAAPEDAVVQSMVEATPPQVVVEKRTWLDKVLGLLVRIFERDHLDAGLLMTRALPSSVAVNVIGDVDALLAGGVLPEEGRITVGTDVMDTTTIGIGAGFSGRSFGDWVMFGGKVYLGVTAGELGAQGASAVSGVDAVYGFTARVYGEPAGTIDMGGMALQTAIKRASELFLSPDRPFAVIRISSGDVKGDAMFWTQAPDGNPLANRLDQVLLMGAYKDHSMEGIGMIGSGVPGFFHNINSGETVRPLESHVHAVIKDNEGGRTKVIHVIPDQTLFGPGSTLEVYYPQ
jgi:hypothetical protein